MVTNVYVDGPNLYYAVLKDTLLRWLDVVTWSSRLLPDHEIKRVRYFTAWANPARSGGPQADRQRVYLRALRTSPKVSLHFGRCIKDTVDLPEPRRFDRLHSVVKVRQKGVDVALATHLLVDAAQQDCDTAVIVSSDSDLRVPVLAARQQLGLRVGVINPVRHRGGWALREHVDFHIRPRQDSYPAARFPLILTDRGGEFRAPKSWVTK